MKDTVPLAKRKHAVAIKDKTHERKVPEVAAAGRGHMAEKIVQLAYEHGIQVREDSALAEMLSTVELDSPIPSESFGAIAEILYYLYQLNGEPNPFDLEAEREKDDLP